MAKTLSVYQEIFRPSDLQQEDGQGNVRLSGDEAKNTLELAVRYLQVGIMFPGDAEALKKLKKAFPKAWDEALSGSEGDAEAAEQSFLSGLSAGYDGEES